MKTKLLKSLDFFFVLRPTLFFPVWTVSLAGVWAQLRFASGETEPYARLSAGSWDITIWVSLFLFTHIMAASFLLNQIADIESDRVNNKLYLIASGAITIRQAYLETAVLVILPLLALTWMRWQLSVVAALAFMVTGWGYSCRPLMLENKPWGGLLTNIIGALTIFCYGWMTIGRPEFQMVYRAFPYLLGILAVYFLTTIPDIRGDAAANKITIAVHCGAQRVITLALVTDVLAIMVAALMRDWVVLVPTLLVLPFFIQTFHRKTTDAALRTNKFAALFLSLMMCVRFPAYLIIIGVLFLFCKWYYAARFNIKYPSFSL
ncbi:UbiA family prenyltransferase [candidate division KSB1 bacterium]|nr:UbiA family prenyltransferase [candidate division KSB1 bacterium]